MAILPESLDYSDRDFDALKARLERAIQSVFPQFSNFDVATFSTTLLEAFCFVGDVNTYYQNRNARDAYWPTAQQRKSLLNLGKLIGYRPGTQTASTVEVSVGLLDGSAPANDVPIPAGTIVRTLSIGQPVRFQTLAAATLAAGETSVLVTAENSENRAEAFTSTGLPNMELKLSEKPFLDGSLLIEDELGSWTVVETFLDSTAADRHVTVTVDQDDIATVRFGNGSSGAIPTGTISVEYKIGGGAEGVVDAGTVTKIEGSFADALGVPVRLAVTNPAASTPAVNRPTREEIRVEGPERLRTLTRTVGRDDYEINAKRVPTVQRALMLTSDQDASIAENSGLLFVIPEGGGLPSETLKADVLEEVVTTRPRTTTFQVEVRDPVYLPVNVRTVVYLKAGYETADAKASAKATITSAIEALFALKNSDGSLNDNIDFGFNLKDDEGNPDPRLAWSTIFNAIRDSAPVRRTGAGDDGLTLNGSADDIELELREFPTLGTVTIINGATGSEL